jgi:hypothetical protein
MEKTKTAQAVEQTLPADENTAAFDLDAFDVLEKANAGIEIELKTDDGKATNLFVRVLGKDADTFREISFAQQTKRMSNMASNGGKFAFDAAEADEEALDLLAACVTSWSVGKEPWLGYVLRKGEQVPCTKAQVKKLLRSYPGFREQVDVAIGNRANFMKG